MINRKPGEKFTVGGVVVEVLGVCRGKVRLGIVADRSVAVMRAELLTPDQLARVEAAIRGEEPDAQV